MSRGSYNSSRSRGGTQEDRPPPHSLYFGTKLRGQKNFSRDRTPPPLSKAMDDCPLPLISRSESATVQWCWGLKKVQWEMALGLHPLLGNIWDPGCWCGCRCNCTLLELVVGSQSIIILVQILMPLFASNKTLLSQLCSISIVHQLSLSYLKGMLP